MQKTTQQPVSARRRQLRVVTRERIADAALQLFEERGFEGTTIDDIAAMLSISQRTIFRYYPTKVDIAVAGAMRESDLMTRVITESPQTMPLSEILPRALAALADCFEADRDRWARQFRLIQSSPTLRMVARRGFEVAMDGLRDAIALRIGQPPGAGVVRVLADTLSAIAYSGSPSWVNDPSKPVREVLHESYLAVASVFGDPKRAVSAKAPN